MGLNLGCPFRKTTSWKVSSETFAPTHRGRRYYSGGVYSSSPHGRSDWEPVDHAVLLVGYGLERGRASTGGALCQAASLESVCKTGTPELAIVPFASLKSNPPQKDNEPPKKKPHLDSPKQTIAFKMSVPPQNGERGK